ncbi:unnamed protein product [Trifolium pratense]|uniref:Uncharacterized protein n=1 Tax=Trifolium pratense TaxID=57577 RepID=A0ACB0KEY8_TRIPR|nr:unnamed protein product [Trifolium pratense]
MFIYALIIFFFTFLVESFAYKKTNIPCKYIGDCPPSGNRYAWLCKENFCIRLERGEYVDIEG